MEISYIEKNKMQADIGRNIYCNTIDHLFEKNNTIVFEKGFFFILVINGTATVSNTEQAYTVGTNNLIILTPSRRIYLHNRSNDFIMTCLYFHPNYFDGLPDGLVMYHQLSRLRGKYDIPIICIEQDTFEYIRATISLFSEQLTRFRFYEKAITLHLCGLLLLQITDALCKNGHEIPVDIRRSDQIFRDFKKYAVQNYKEHHDILFYANRLNISTTYLSRIVKCITGRTVRAHLSELICHEAIKLLDSTDMDIKEIANQLGFSDQSVFGKFFARATGISPLKYRLRKREPDKG